VRHHEDPLDYLFSLEHFGIKFGLGNIRTLLGALGNPHTAFPSVHIAGTNGKGSVTAMVERALRLHARTGRYTSPHLVSLTERFAIDGVPVPIDALRDVVAHLRDVITDLQQRGELDVHPTFFEVTTAAAFELFRRANIGIGIFEVGLGGRLDATNVLTPAVTAITTIARDHERYLGDSLESIAREKAGIIKPDVPVVVGNLPPAALSAIQEIAAARNAPLIVAHEGATISGIATRDERVDFNLCTPRRNYGRLSLSLGGAHQVENAVVAVRVLEALEASGWPLDADAVRAAFADVYWPGRLQRIRRSDGREALLDAAHNPEGAIALAAHLAATGRRHPIVFAAMHDKDAAAIVRALAPVTSLFIVTRASNPRSHTPEALAALVGQEAPALTVLTMPSAVEALDCAWQHDTSIVVAGSIFLLGDVIASLGRAW
jgi:dihydrofolate synthase/folylpolyglutamate synthase